MQNHSLFCRLTYFTCGVALMFTARASADEKVTLKLNLPVGSTWTFDNTQEMNSDMKATLNGQTQPYTQKMASHRVGKAEVVASSNGEPTAIRFTFDEGCESSMSTGQQEQKMPFPYAGKTVTVTRGSDGEVKDDFNDQVDPQSFSELHSMIVQEQVIFPQQPVAIGDEWKADPKILSSVTDLKSPNDRAGMTLKLLDTHNEAGKQIATVKVSMAIMREMQGMNSTVIMQGTANIDLATGHTFKTEMAGTNEIKGEQQGPGPNGQPVTYQIAGTGKLTSTLTAPLTSTITGTTPAPVDNGNQGGGGNPLAGASFAGKFTDGKLTAEWTESNGTYTGTLALGEKKFPATGKANGQKIEGNFKAGADSFPFNGTLDGDTLMLTTSGKTYTLTRQKPPAVNPLGGDAPPQPANPLAPGASNSHPGALPDGYKFITRTDVGSAMGTRKPDARSVSAALASALPDLSRYFDAKPRLSGAYEDIRDHRSGGASFTAMLHGQPVKGVLSCKMGDKGATLAVLYAKANATPADWSKITAAAPGGGGGGSPKIPPLREYQFPDNTGSIGLPDGWKTNAQSCNGMVVIEGPAGQAVTMGMTLSAVTPNSMAVQTQMQLEQNARQMGTRVPPLGLLVAPFSKPTDAFANLMPQVDRMSRSKGGAGFAIDHLQHLADIKPILPGGQASVIAYGLTESARGQQKHSAVLANVEVDPISNDSFLMGVTGASAPDATFQQDVPTMLAIISSLRENAAVIGEQTRENIAAQNERFRLQQEAHKELMATYDSYNKTIARNSVIQSRSVDDFDETIIGYRTVQDTTTGEKRSVDLGNVDQIVDNLNYYDPGRFKQIPLRDEADPLPTN